MAIACRRDRWDHTSEILAIMAEINRDRRKRRRPFHGRDFHPLPDRRRQVEEASGARGIAVTAETIGSLAASVVGRPAG